MEDFFLESLGQKHGCTLHMAKYSDPLDSESPEQKILSNPGESLKKEVLSLVVLWMRHSAREGVRLSISGTDWVSHSRCLPFLLSQVRALCIRAFLLCLCVLFARASCHW